MTQATGKRTLALVVDDDPATRSLEADVLESAGFAVVQAKNGEDALRVAQERQPGVVLLDLALPTASGFDVLRMLKRRPATSEIPVLLVSAYASLVEDCASRGASSCLAKPFDIDNLLSEVRGVLDQPSRAATISREERPAARVGKTGASP
ncbi:MAG TPA: response regulator [Chloroflexota bacterium]